MTAGSTITADVPSEAYKAGEWNTLRVRVEPEKITCFVNGKKVIETDDTGLRGARELLPVPVVGVFSGALFLGEAPGWTEFAALALVVGSLATVISAPRRKAASP